MARKLIKHEFRLNGRGVIGVFLVQLFLLLLVMATSYLPTGSAGGILAVTEILSMFAAGASSVVVTVILLMSYDRSMHGGLAYFTHATPVRTAAHYWTKMLWAAIVLFISLTLTLITTYVASTNVATRSAGQNVAGGTILREAFTTYPNVIALIVAGVFLSCIELAAIASCFITLGHHPALMRFGAYGGVVLMAVVLFAARNALQLLMIGFFPYSISIAPISSGENGLTLSLTQHTMFQLTYVDSVPLGTAVALVITIVVCAWLSVRTLNRRLSLR